MAHFGDHGETLYKNDHSPVTDADLEADRCIRAGLRALLPSIPVISEEAEQQEIIDPAQPFWLVDPLDGTRSFVRGEQEFTVNIALVVDRKPFWGVIYIPATGVVYAGGALAGAFCESAPGARTPIAARAAPQEGLTVMVSHFHASPKMEAFLENYPVHSRCAASSSLKFCVLAEGKADLYPRLGRTMEWDTAAGHAILLAAGGGVTTLDGAPLAYGKPGFENPHFIASGWRRDTSLL